MPHPFALAESLNARCARHFGNHRPRLDELGITSLPIGGAEVFDFATGHPGTLAGGLLLAELCLSGLAKVELSPGRGSPAIDLPTIDVHTSHPLLACMASQYAGWPVSAGNYFAMGSGPARIARQREPYFERYPLTDSSREGWLVLESSRLPDAETVEQIASETNLAAAGLKIAVARTASFPGTIQVAARSIETTMHKLFELDFDLACIRAAQGSCPLPPVGKNDLQAIGWTNDAILYGSRVWLWVDCEQEAVEAAAQRLPANTSPDCGRPFAEIFERYGRDFYAIDPLLFSPAWVTLHNLRTGKAVVTGELRPDILRESFGLPPGVGPT